ncbi:MAG: hypothetical protein GX417_10185 [Clostridiales bacterium]|nr:hypothetical protein [Clostridiales bacterium]
MYDQITSSKNFTEQLAFTLWETARTSYKEENSQEQTIQVAQFVAKMASKTVMELGKQVKTFDATKDEETRRIVHTSIVNETIRNFPVLGLKKEDLDVVVEQAIDTCVQALTDNVIPIPIAVVQPFTEVKRGFYPFKLDTRNMVWHPSDDILVGTELQEGGQTFELTTSFNLFSQSDTVENEVARHHN